MKKIMVLDVGGIILSEHLLTKKLFMMKYIIHYNNIGAPSVPINFVLLALGSK